MNRQIKFRIWDKVNNKFLWFFSNDLFDTIFAQSHSDGPIIQARVKIFIRSNIDYEINQFTGLHDKNGKEIYEGDILRHHSYEGWFWRGVVKFSHGVFGVEWLTSEKNLSMLGSWGQLHNLRKLDDGYNEKQIVIGNIYQNPELLNK